jgi:hypothetical protein
MAKKIQNGGGWEEYLETGIQSWVCVAAGID